METSLSSDFLREALARLSGPAVAPSARTARQPVHTVYGGAHLFRAGTARKLGDAALRLLHAHAPETPALSSLLGFPGTAEDARSLHDRVVAKLEREPVEDYRIDFEDGYGARPDAEEDAHATQAAREMAHGLERGELPPFCGLRVKPLAPETGERSLRTLDLFLTTLLRASGGRLPSGFVVTLPKVRTGDEVRLLSDALARLESAHGQSPGALPLEIMVETPGSLLAPDGRAALPALVAAAHGRCRGAHFGTYDFTASLGLVAGSQRPDHPACAFARALMQLSLAGGGVWLSDGATTLLPVEPHRAPEGEGLTEAQLRENRAAVHAGWRRHAQDVLRSLDEGFYQGWDLHPGQLVSRYAAVYAFFHRHRHEAGRRLRAFLDGAARATRVDTAFDDAATGQGLLQFFLRGLECGALDPEEALAGGLAPEELRTRSFVRIVEARRGADRLPRTTQPEIRMQ